MSQIDCECLIHPWYTIPWTSVWQHLNFNVDYFCFGGLVLSNCFWLFSLVLTCTQTQWSPGFPLLVHSIKILEGVVYALYNMVLFYIIFWVNTISSTSRLFCFWFHFLLIHFIFVSSFFLPERGFFLKKKIYHVCACLIPLKLTSGVDIILFFRFADLTIGIKNFFVVGKFTV